MRGSSRQLPGQLCQPLRWDGSEQMPEPLRPAGDQLLDTRKWRSPALVGGDGIEPPASNEVGNITQAITQAVEDIRFGSFETCRPAWSLPQLAASQDVNTR